uniref:Tail protein n=1 Tax=viral metagenome TaxID=1070528 RepID=A0A6M3KGT6_9ZZZZ
MANTPSLVTLISGITEGLKDDSRLSDVPDASIYYGPEPNIPKFPAITVELSDANPTWKTFGGTNGGGKDLEAIFIIRIFDEAYDYVTGLQSVETIAKNVSDVLHAKTGLSGLAYQTYPQAMRFGNYELNNVPVFGCELELLTKSRFVPASN